MLKDTGEQGPGLTSSSKIFFLVSVLVRVLQRNRSPGPEFSRVHKKCVYAERDSFKELARSASQQTENQG